jgi:hypothetical protein
MTTAPLLLGGLPFHAWFLGQTVPVDNPIWSLANFGVLGIMAALYLLSHKREIDRLEKQVEAANKRAEAAEARTAAVVADSSAVRDATLREVVPAMTLATDRGDRMMELTERLLGIVLRFQDRDR